MSGVDLEVGYFVGRMLHFVSTQDVRSALEYIGTVNITLLR